MDIKSIRWQLPLSYAGIALLAALVLGAVMLLRLGSYYSQLEYDYMLRSAQSIQSALRPFPIDRFPQDLLAAQANTYALFSSSHLKLLDKNGHVLADSGSAQPQSAVIRFFSLPAGYLSSSGGAAQSDLVIMDTTQSGVAIPNPTGDRILYFSASTGPAVQTPSTQSFGASGGLAVESTQAGQTYPGNVVVSLNAGGPVLSPVSSMPLIGAFSSINPDREVDPSQRSPMSVDLPLLDQQGNTVGKIVLSEGPAYGRSILNSVIQAWALSGILAVLLAAAAGWLASRRVTRPLLALTQVTEKMAAGDLSIRAPFQMLPTHEFSTLGVAFNRMASRIEEMILSLRRFIADAAHELKTPLTVLRTDLELLQDENDPQRRALYSERSLSQVKQLDHLVSELLDLSRLESSARTELPALVDLKGVIDRLSEVYAAQAEQAGINFELVTLPEALLIRASQTHLEQAIGNLLDNALKFTPPGGMVRFGAQKQPDGLRLWVSDTGMGVPEEDLSQVFNRFHRGKNASAYPGSGLGLPIAQAIIQAHHGYIQVENNPEGGACFTITLPGTES